MTEKLVNIFCPSYGLSTCCFPPGEPLYLILDSILREKRGGRNDMNKIPVLLDCDTGFDDAFAIAMAIASDRLEVKGVTTVAGNYTCLLYTSLPFLCARKGFFLRE